MIRKTYFNIPMAVCSNCSQAVAKTSLSVWELKIISFLNESLYQHKNNFDDSPNSFVRVFCVFFVSSEVDMKIKYICGKTTIFKKQE